jgi:hypothetical protein
VFDFLAIRMDAHTVLSGIGWTLLVPPTTPYVLSGFGGPLMVCHHPTLQDVIGFVLGRSLFAIATDARVLEDMPARGVWSADASQAATRAGGVAGLAVGPT